MLVLTCLQMKAGRQAAAACANLWLEKTAFFKVPRALQDETAETHRRPLEDVSRCEARHEPEAAFQPWVWTFMLPIPCASSVDVSHCAP